MVNRFSVAVVTVLLLGCGAASNKSSTPSTGAPSTGTASTSTSSGAGGAPALLLDAGAAKRETYAFEDGGAKEFLTFEKERVRVSASCLVNNTLMCDAVSALRKGKQVKLPPEAPVGVSPGALACKQMGMKNRTGRAASGNEDGFCLFTDGSMASTGSLDLYVIE
jgi:hypothetical protein